MAESFENLHIILRGWAKDFLQDLWISQFNPAFAVSFHPTRSADCRVKFDSGMRDFPGSIFDQSQIFGTHSNQWVCVILYGLRQIWLFSRSSSPKWAKAGFRVMLEDFEIYKKASVFCSSAFSLLYQTNVFYLAVHLFSNRLQKTSSLVRTTVTPSAITSCVTFCSYHILESSAIYYWTEAQLHGIFLLNSQLNATCLVGYPSSKLYP